ncbi:uncharacterized protein B0I36DRAFT_348537 [Microdochium trichocladiopsis]|uniref:NAD-dependent epimerase/dehydratase domain-containing protein n=1 Tax=Microdochium trichocladiopsis TaxID=1682393 RepID=A0A9P8YCC1_9PEZI|nr:uncharacterized protein B0I36DRAFT_348537 [Microdochium trichocladiopsis]KAH7033488.1 hypothetical protein B0I36DRAFT_348537 [Microdochium trichocladiopsis]
MSDEGPILVTGVNGYLGARAAEAVLKAGYSVRGTVRKVDAGQKTKDALVALGYDASRIELVEVPDISPEGAFDKAVVGCSAILHVAAPITDIFVLAPPDVVRVATEATTRIVDSAIKYAGPELRSIVLMSSSAALFDIPPVPARYDENNWAENSYKAVMTPEILEKIDPAHRPLMAYAAAKLHSEREFWKKRDEVAAAGGDHAKISFTAIQATWFFGPPVVPWPSAKALPYSASWLTRVLAGEDPAAARMMAGTLPSEAAIDVRDVARVLVWAALNPDKADGERFLCSAGAGGSQAVADILDRVSKTGEVPELSGYVVKNKGTPGKGYGPDYSLKTDEPALEFDGSKVVKATGVDYIPFEQSVLDTVKFALPVVTQS